MTFFTGGPADYSAGQPQNIESLRSTFGQSFGASLAAGAMETPVMRLAGAALRTGAGSLGEPLQPDEANRRYGLPDLKFDKPITDALAGDLWNDRKTQMLRDQAIASGPRNIFARGANFIGGMIPQFLDPVNAASVFIPGLGEEAVGAALVRGAAVADRIGAESAASGLTGAASALEDASAALDATRAGRAVKGSVSGIAGQAALEPLNYELDQSEHRDWSMNQALANLAFGAVLGGLAGGILPKHRTRGDNSAENPKSGNGERDIPGEPVPPPDMPPTPESERLDTLTPEQRGSVMNEAVSAMVQDRPSVAREVMDHLDPMRSVEDHGPFGPVFRQFSHDAQGAIAHLTEQQTGEAVGALFHPEIGDIDLPWGKAGTGASDGYGLSKLVKFHPEVLSDLQGVIDGMNVATRSKNRVRLESPDHLAAVSLNYLGEKKSWLLTAYRKEEAENISRDARTDTAPLASPDDTASRGTDLASESASMDTAPLAPPDDTASRRTGEEEEIAQDIARFQQEAQARATNALGEAATRAVMDEAPDVTQARQTIDRMTRNAPELGGSALDADAAEAERMASEAEAQLKALMGDEELTGEDKAIADMFDQAAEQLAGDAKAYESAAACLWRNS